MITSYINGKYTVDPSIPAFDLGFLRGYGVVETLRTYKRIPIFLDRHLKRLESSAKEAKIPLRNSLEEMQTIIDNLIEKNGFSDSVIRIIATKGITQDGITPKNGGSLFILTSPLLRQNPAVYQKGISAITTNESRQCPHIKTLNYFRSLTLLEDAKQKGASEVIYCDNGYILEGTVCNFFAVKQSTIITPKEGILYGITREIILEITKNLFPIEERPIEYLEIPTFDEAFTSSSIKGIVPIVFIDDQKIGNGVPGKATEKISSLFSDISLQLALN